jgi:hypothetical protein
MLADYYQFLKKFLSFRSVSCDSSFFSEMEATTSRLKEEFEKYDIQTKIIQGYGNPIVL